MAKEHHKKLHNFYIGVNKLIPDNYFLHISRSDTIIPKSFIKQIKVNIRLIIISEANKTLK